MECEVVNWIQLAHVTVRWWALVNTEMKLRFSQIVWNFLIIWKNIGV